MNTDKPHTHSRAHTDTHSYIHSAMKLLKVHVHCLRAITKNRSFRKGDGTAQEDNRLKFTGVGVGGNGIEGDSVCVRLKRLA